MFLPKANYLSTLEEIRTNDNQLRLDCELNIVLFIGNVLLTTFDHRQITSI